MSHTNAATFIAIPYFPSHQCPTPSSRRARHRQACCSVMSDTKPTKPVIITDVLDTLVRDPFYVDMASYFDCASFQEFLSAKTPDVWVNFELGRIDEQQLAHNFFKERPPIDILAFKRFLSRSYQLLPGVESMLETFKNHNLDVHACSNYPAWTGLIEQAVGLNERFNVHWTFVSAHHGIRKPDPRAFSITASLAKVDVSSCILLDDRKANCEAALTAGYRDAVYFQNVPQALPQLRSILSQCGIDVDFNV